VKDGTLCDPDTLSRCVAGKCVAADCNNTIGGSAMEADCLVSDQRGTMRR